MIPLFLKYAQFYVKYNKIPKVHSNKSFSIQFDTHHLTSSSQLDWFWPCDQLGQLESISVKIYELFRRPISIDSSTE